ncbi:hypothetical protein BDY24DRAFT_391063 [Mrakia frigida]|uniref:uncharacterized protein n=1 Tax=Mrakia frigida TaxID=29902 RepID=UPI003FCBFE2E
MRSEMDSFDIGEGVDFVIGSWESTDGFGINDHEKVGSVPKTKNPQEPLHLNLDLLPLLLLLVEILPFLLPRRLFCYRLLSLDLLHLPFHSPSYPEGSLPSLPSWSSCAVGSSYDQPFSRARHQQRSMNSLRRTGRYLERRWESVDRAVGGGGSGFGEKFRRHRRKRRRRRRRERSRGGERGGSSGESKRRLEGRRQ